MLRPALVRFAALSIVVTVVLTLLTLAVAERIARERALEDARRQGAGIATRLAAPLVDSDVRNGVPGAAEPLRQVMGNRTLDGSLTHVKLWSRDGTVIWADQPEIVGRTFPLTGEVEALFGTTATTAELSDLSRKENVAERSEGPMLEVYAGAFDADGEPLVFEAYLDTGPMDESAQRIVTSFVPLIVGSLLLFQAVVLPLAVSLSRRVERGERDRARLMRHAVLALRHFMTDIYPPDLEGPGLRDAVQQLVQSEALAAGLAAEVRMASDLELPRDAAGLAHRVVREALRNVVKHADAHRVVVEAALHQGEVFIRVSDDGRGAAGGLPLTSPQGHLGLRLLADTVRDTGGRLEATSEGAGRGVTLVARFPVSLRGG